MIDNFQQAMVGYSGTPLVKKLGIKPGMSVCILNAPASYGQTLGALPDAVEITPTLQGELDFIHFFTQSKADFERHYFNLKAHLAKTGMLWVSWPKKASKKASKIETDMTEDVIRNFALGHGLVDVKVVAIDDVWSGLKLVYRLKDR